MANSSAIIWQQAAHTTKYYLLAAQEPYKKDRKMFEHFLEKKVRGMDPVSYTHLRAHETA